MVSSPWLVLIACSLLLCECCHGFQFQPLKSFGSRCLLQDSKSSSFRLEMADKDYDLCVIGGGVVGVQAALKAASALNKKVLLIDAPRASGMLMNEATGEDLSLGAPTGLFSKALRDSSKNIKVASLRGMGLREERYALHIPYRVCMIMLLPMLIFFLHVFLLLLSRQSIVLI